jgi:hypothetical protein
MKPNFGFPDNWLPLPECLIELLEKDYILYGALIQGARMSMFGEA